VCGILGPVAWIMGHIDLGEMRAGRMDPSGEGLTNAGRICGIVATLPDRRPGVHLRTDIPIRRRGGGRILPVN
jgi:hypothetical protein